MGETDSDLERWARFRQRGGPFASPEGPSSRDTMRHPGESEAGNQGPPAANPGEPPPIRLEVTDILDLHSFAPREITALVTAYLSEARAKGFPSVRIIHGKGRGVQRAQLHSLLRKTPEVARYEDAPMEAGSWGATVVWFAPQK